MKKTLSRSGVHNLNYINLDVGAMNDRSATKTLLEIPSRYIKIEADANDCCYMNDGLLTKTDDKFIILHAVNIFKNSTAIDYDILDISSPLKNITIDDVAIDSCDKLKELLKSDYELSNIKVSGYDTIVIILDLGSSDSKFDSIKIITGEVPIPINPLEFKYKVYRSSDLYTFEEIAIVDPMERNNRGSVRVIRDKELRR